MGKLLRFVGVAALFFIAGKAYAAGGTCPANSPLNGQNACYFVAANGSDSNSGTSESSPWLHAPGMPNCTGNCGALSAGNGAIGIIVRGGDAYHEGNASASPYTGGTWDLYGWFSNAYGGSIPNCAYEGTQTGCLYVGVDTSWSNSSTCGSSWCRPVITGDNSTSTGFVASCAYQINNPGGNFGPNIVANIPGFTIFDSFELTGLCVSSSSTSSGNTYLSGWASGGSNGAIAMLENTYMHGWTATSAAGTGSASHPVTVISGGGGVQQVFDHIVIDGSDSNPQVAAWGAFPIFTHMRDSIVRYVGQGVGQGCHDIHDNIFEHFYYTELDGHINAFECNADASTNTANVFYNNIFRHFDPSFGNGEIVWFCPNTTPEYWFNNVMFDVVAPGQGQPWNVVGPPIYSGCSNTGGQYMFNNTLVNVNQPCYLTNSSTHGSYLNVFNEHLIDTAFDLVGGATCVGGPSSATNISMTGATATAQGYTSGSSGTVSPNTCANDPNAPCRPTSATSPTVGAGTNEQAYCNVLASFTSEPAISKDAASACANGTTDGCSYNATTHSMTCPVQTALARPGGGKAWDSGAYQYSPGPSSPINLTAQPLSQ
jgi:hypothetical protein